MTALEDEITAIREAARTAAAAEAPRREVDAAMERVEARALGLAVELAAISEAHGAELAQIEGLLRERAQAIHGLERELKRRERIVHDLVATLADATPLVSEMDAQKEAHEEAIAQLRAKLDALALESARREGELQSRAWRIQELEEAAGRGGAAAADAKLARAEDELDMLRKAMVVEHQTRVRNESDLVRARAEIERQTALIEQLSRELDARDRLGIAHEARES